MKKRFSAFLALIIIVSGCMCFSAAYADDVNWEYNAETKTLHIFGIGKMENYQNEYSLPWAERMYDIHNVVIDEGVTSIGDYSFSGAKNLTNVSIPSTLKEIGAYAFSSCSKLNSLTFGDNITSIADVSFAYDGIILKPDFHLNVCSGSYAMSFAFDNSVPFVCDSVDTGTYTARIYVAGMTAYYPFTPEYNGTYSFYSSGVSDTFGVLYDSDFNKLAENDDFGNEINFKINHQLNANHTYYIGVNLISPKATSVLKITIEPVSYFAACRFYAALNPQGTPSAIELSGVEYNGNIYNGAANITVDSENNTATFKYGIQTKTVVLSPERDNVITFVACDANCDGYVNAKDYAILSKKSSEYISLFDNFINYAY